MTDERDKIADRLNSLVSIYPSRCWLDACLQHVNATESSISEFDDYCAAVLHQILHSDLRNVVRHDTENSDPSSRNETNNHSDLLRNAITESINRTSARTQNRDEIPHPTSTKVSLPPTFRLLVQIEELLDVSLNAEDRLKVGPTTLSSPTPIGNQRHRCLKMVLSDGYSHREEPSLEMVDSAKSDSSFIAMELSPILNLSVNSQPGVKILLRGNITIRMGLLLLNEANAIVLGGCVADLIPYQQKAREKAARIAGVGVDPTIKALIGNSQKEVEEDQDEGEQESVDVTERSRIGGTSNQFAAHRGIQLNDPTSLLPPNNTSTTHSSHATSRAAHAPVQGLPNFSSAQQYTVSTTTINDNRNLPNNKSLIDGASSRSVSNPYSRLPETSTTAQTKTSSVFATSHIHGASMGANTSNEDGRTIIANNHLTTNRIADVHTIYKPSTGNMPMVQHDSVGFRPSSTTITTTATTRSHYNHLQNPRPTLGADTNQPSKTDIGPFHMDHTLHMPIQPVTGDTYLNNASHTANDLLTRYSGLASSHPALYKVLSFAEFRSLLQLLLRDPVMYSSYDGKTFIVPSKISLNQPPWSFKIQKNKIWKSKSEKYYYGSTVKMTGIDVKDGDSITCRLSNSILEACIGVPPDQLRILSQNEDTKQKANSTISDGVKKALDQLRKLVSCNFKLLLSKDEMFPSSAPDGGIISQVDGDDQPILMLNSFDVS